MSSDEDDFLNYTPLQRSQVSNRESKPNRKPSRLSSSFRKSQKSDIKPKKSSTPSKADGKAKISSTSSKADGKAKINSTPSKASSSKISKAVKKKTPIKSRADEPDKDCNEFELAKWRFLFGSEVGKAEEKPRSLIMTDPGGESSCSALASSQQKRKSTSEESVPGSSRKKQDAGICSHCSFPFNTFQEKSLHSILCESKDLSDLPRCPTGNQCWATEETHFWKFSHTEKSINTSVESPCTAMKTITVKVQVGKTDPNNSYTNDSGYNGIAGPSTSRIPSQAGEFPDSPDVELPDSPDIILLSDVEESTHCDSHDSMPLFELPESEDKEAHADKASCTFENSHESSNLLDDPITPDIELHEDDQSTLYFGDDNKSTQSSPSKEQDGQEVQKSPVNNIPEKDVSGSETPELRNVETQDETGGLEDSEGDELIASLAEEAVDQFAMPVLEKVMKWRKGCKIAQTSTPTTEESSHSPDRTVVQPICFHFHYYEASPAPSPSKEKGQTSIMSFFKPTKSKEESCPCDEKKTVSKQENIAAWQELMNRMQKKRLVSLPSVSQSSSAEEDL